LIKRQAAFKVSIIPDEEQGKEVRMAVQIAYVAEGKLYVKRGERAPQMIESTFAQNMIDRAAQLADRHGWRSREEEDGGFFTHGTIWGKAALRQQDVRQIRITGLSKMPKDGSLLYSLDMGAVGGLFTYDLAEQYENRLFHRQEFRASDLSHHPVKSLVALSLPREDGTAAIALMEPGGKGLRPITEGDSLDQAPSWGREQDRDVLVYQSAGIGRNNYGHSVALGPYAICKLDLDRETLTTVMEDGRWDYLVPREWVADGGKQTYLYYIRRPYKATGHGSYSPLKLLVDILLFPFRLLRAIFFFLNFFSVMFTRKPLTTAGGPKTDPKDTRFMMLHGKWIDAEKAMKAAAKGKPVPLVPESWELMRMDESGKSQSLAGGVLSFDLAADGTVVYTNGSEIYVIGQDGKSERVCAHRMIQQVIAI